MYRTEFIYGSMESALSTSYYGQLNFFLLAITAETLLSEICLNQRLLKGWVVRLFVRFCRQRSSLLWTPALKPLYQSNAPAQGEEEIGKCVWCMCESCRVEEGTVGERLVGYF